MRRRLSKSRLGNVVRVVGTAGLAGAGALAFGGCPQGGLLTCSLTAAQFGQAIGRAQSAAEACNFEPPCPDFCDALADAEAALNTLVSQNCFSDQFPDLAGQLQAYQEQIRQLRDEVFAAAGCD